MPALTLAALRQQFASGSAGSLYALVGADDNEKTAVAAQFAEIVDEDLRAFNVERMYGGEMKVADLVDSASTMPMMAARRVVVVLEAEKLFIPKRESKAAEQELERLESFLDTVPDHATIVFVCGPLDMRRRVVKKVLKLAAVVDCGSIQTPADAEHWVKARAARDGVKLEPAAARALVERTGLDLPRLRAGLERVGLYAMGRTVTPDDIREAVTAGPEVQVDFGIAKAIWRDDARGALKELGLAFEAGAVPVMVMGQLRAAAEKLPAARIRTAMEAVFQADLALKSSMGDPRILLERLVVELCGTNAAGAGRSGGASRPGGTSWGARTGGGNWPGRGERR